MKWAADSKFPRSFLLWPCACQTRPWVGLGKRRSVRQSKIPHAVSLCKIWRGCIITSSTPCPPGHTLLHPSSQY